MGDTHLTALVISGNLTVGGTIGLTGAMTLASTLGVTGATTLTGGVTVGAGTAVTKVKAYTKTFDAASVNANTVSAQTVTVTGLVAGEIVVVNPPINTIGISGAYVSGADELTIIYTNPTAGAIDPASGDYLILAFTV